MSKTLDVNIVHPTHSDCVSFPKEHVTMYFHFIYRQYQVTINYSARGYHVLTFGFVPPDVRLLNYDCAHWHKVESFDSLADAIPLYCKICDYLIKKILDK